MRAAHPYLNFNGNAQAAFDFYKSVFGGDFQMLVRFKDFPGGAGSLPEGERNRIAHVALPLGETMLMASDVPASRGESLHTGNNVYIMVTADTAEEAERLFGGLAAGGRIEMALQKTEWAEKYGICADKFGVQWMVAYTGQVQFTRS